MRQTSFPGKQQDKIQAPSHLSYDRLPAGQYIRLLQIAHQPESGTISVHLTAFPLDSVPRFWALSYTWGPPRHGADYEHYKTSRRTIQCNGHPAVVGENLYQFLLQARRSRLFIHQELTGDGNVPESEEPYVYLSQLSQQPVKSEPRISEDGNPDETASPNFPASGQPPRDAAVEAPLGRTAYIWVDALCIDQENIHEKSVQVGIMDAIYGRAQRVLIWLGPREPNDDVLWAVEEFVPLLYCMVSQDAQGVYKKKSLALTDHAFAELGEESCERWRMSLFALISFFSRSRWFERGWVAQEAFALDVSSVAVLAGRRPIRFEQVLQLTTILDHHFSFSDILPMLSRQEGHDPEDKAFWPGSNTMSNLRRFPLLQYHLRRYSSSDRPWEAILGLLDKMSVLQFADARDHVYGCLGLIKTMVGPLPELMVPDYRLTAREVFMGTAELMVRNIHELDILFSFVGRQEGYHPASSEGRDTPSWVPDFTVPKRENTLYRSLQMDASTRSTAPKVGSGQVSAAELKDETLFVEGARLDSVSDSTHIGPVSARRYMRCDWLLDYLFLPGVYPFGGQTRDRAILETLATTSDFESLALMSVVDSAKEWYALTLSRCFLEEEDDIDEFFASKLASSREPRPWLPTPDAVLKVLGLDDAMFLGVRNRNDWHHLTKNNMVGRSLLETEDGYLVLGPRAAKPRDEIWIVKGSRLPVILRKSKKQKGFYNILGVVYIHGLNFDDAINRLEPSMRRVGLV